MSNQTLPIACDLSVFSPEQREQLEGLSPEIFSAVIGVRELPNGYAFQLPETFPLAKLAEFITYDKLCCPFLEHGIIVDPRGGSVWLSMAGGEGVKPFVVVEIGGNNLLREEVVLAAGFKL
jgi:hypothetical protein